MKTRIMICILFVSIFTVSTRSFSQSYVGDTTYNKEIVRLERFFYLDVFLFTVQTNYYELDSTGNHYDTLKLTYLLHDDSIQVIGPNMEMMQNDQFRIFVNTEDSTMQVENPKPFINDMLKLNLTESEFIKTYTSGYSITDSSNIRTMKIQFKPSSPVFAYTIIYDTVNYQIKTINYKLKKCNCDGPSNEMLAYALPGGYISITLSYVFAHDPIPVNDSFQTSRYIISRGGKFEPVAPFENFELINLVTEQ